MHSNKKTLSSIVHSQIRRYSFYSTSIIWFSSTMYCCVVCLAKQICRTGRDCIGVCFGGGGMQYILSNRLSVCFSPTSCLASLVHDCQSGGVWFGRRPSQVQPGQPLLVVGDLIAMQVHLRFLSSSECYRVCCHRSSPNVCIAMSTDPLRHRHHYHRRRRQRSFFPPSPSSLTIVMMAIIGASMRAGTHGKSPWPRADSRSLKRVEVCLEEERDRLFPMGFCK